MLYYKYLLLCFVVILGSCSGRLDDSHAASERKEKKCESLSPGIYQMYPQYLIGNCPVVAPFAFTIDKDKVLHRSDNCKMYKKYFVSKTCENAYYLKCLNEEDGLSYSLVIKMFFIPSELQPSISGPKTFWEGSMDVEFNNLTEGKRICNSLFVTKTIKITSEGM